MNLPTKAELQQQIRNAIINQDKAQASELWRAYQNKEYRVGEWEEPKYYTKEITTYVVNSETTDVADGGQDQVDITNANEWKEPYAFRVLQVILWVRYKAEPFTTYKQTIHVRIWEKARIISSVEALHYQFDITRAYYHSTEWRSYDVLPNWRPLRLRNNATLRVDYLNYSGATIEALYVWLGGKGLPHE